MLWREMQEELGITIHVERLLWVAEHFFTAEENTLHHSLGFYYLITPQARLQFYDQKQAIQTVDGEHGEVAIIFRWFKLHELTNVQLYPSFLPTALLALPPTTKHIVWRAS